LSSEQIDQLLSDSAKSKPTYVELLERFLAIPANQRRERSIARRIKVADFRDAATLESFDWSFNAATITPEPFRELATGEFVRRRENVAFVGDSGLGKSHLIQSIGRSCCVLGYRVRYTTSAKLLTELTAAFGDRSLPSVVRHYGRYELLIIDEFGFDKLERAENADAPSLLYKIIDNRHGRGSTALVTNIDFQHWTDYLGDAPLAMALIDRAVDGANIQRFAGESYRAHRAEQKAASKSRSTNQKASSKTKS
jgi:DNA replication protein DnaC